MLPAQLETALEIKSVAEAASIWPGAPRVPVTIELRDFAQWFGSRSEFESRAIVSYIAAQLKKALSQQVHAQTLLNAFGRGRWLFVFDGLDEVPSDVKDGVAGEVATFINDELIACRADAVSVCTSRPQGYSGQFAVLDAAPIDLVKLSAEQALDCARPVLKIDRSADESEAYFQTLKDAVESPAVREIMTTPLQSHIMAVVVRDGARPPERKWQLYTNFYHVIKKREANRNLPDKRLSALLREGDRLLKAIHNRLGFELHARAETSEGAQTSLDRSDLRRLVRDTVELLQDTNVDSTVKTLMDATTDRLVLVNTPESGEQVRFDIRPLQEFFAAEYIYDSVPAEKLGERIKVIAGDSHWREVLHFLLSGLVENGRQTELAVAISVLADLNASAFPCEARALSRRLALGGIVASRLLQEGVLDQDKRVRQQFHRCLEVMFACTDAPSYLQDVAGSQSNTWLLDTLIDSLLEQSEAENIGACATLALCLPDDHPRIDIVRSYLRSASVQYRSCILQIVSAYVAPYYGARPSADIDEDRLPTWTLDFAFSALIDPGWSELGVEGINAAISILASARERVAEIAERAGLCKSLASLVVPMLFGSATRLHEESLVSVSLGTFRVAYEGLAAGLAYETWDSELWDAFSEAPGIFHVLYNSFLLARDRTASQLRALSHCVEKIPDLPYITSPIARYLPSKLLANSDRISDERICQFFQVEGFGLLRSLITESESTTRPNWKDVLPCLHDIALHLIFEPRLQGERREFQAFVETEEGLSALRELCEGDPRMLLRLIGQWGGLIALNAGMRPILAKAASLELTQFSPHYHPDPKPFELFLPTEAALLPYVVLLLTGLMVSGFSEAFLSNSNSPVNVEEKLDSILVRYVREPTALPDIVCNDALSPQVRAAAAILYLRHPDSSPLRRADLRDELVALYSERIGYWFLPGVAFALTGGICADDAEAIGSISLLLESARSDFDARLQVQPMLRNWRELSRAPVQANSSIQLWRQG